MLEEGEMESVTVNWLQPAQFCSAGPVTAIKYFGYYQDNLCICNDFMYIGFKEM